MSVCRNWFYLAILFSPLFLYSQTTIVPNKTQSPSKQKKASVLMPYNRLIRSAGKVISFGDSTLENHALDICLLPDQQHIVIEDRYGIAVLDNKTNSLVERWTFQNNGQWSGLMSTYSGITSFSEAGTTYIVWGAAGSGGKSALVIAEWKEGQITQASSISFEKTLPADLALPNQVVSNVEDGVRFLYTVLNGNNELVKIRFSDKKIVWKMKTGVAPYGLCIANNKIYVTNWAGPVAIDKTKESAGVPWGNAYVEAKTGATSRGTVDVFAATDGRHIIELEVGLHPTSLITVSSRQLVYVVNGNSDFVSVIDVATDKVIDTIHTGLFGHMKLTGSTPNAIAIDEKNNFLYVANGLDNAILKIRQGSYAAGKKIKEARVIGLIPTEAYPGGLLVNNSKIYVANIESSGANVLTKASDIRTGEGNNAIRKTAAFTSHRQRASVSVIDLPSDRQLKQYTKEVQINNLINKALATTATPRKNILPKPVPERIGEPSVFKHVVYIIKENRTYDQVFGDVATGNGAPDLCTFGSTVTPNQHQLVNQFSLLDNYYCSGKSSAEGHQWTDAAMVTDYIEKNVRAWFRSYPHRQYDALVYGKAGFIWNHAMDHGKKVRIYGEACFTEFDEKLNWTDIYRKYVNKQPFVFRNTSTISRVRPILSQTYPGYDNPKINDQLRADAFIKEWKSYETRQGDSLPDLMIVALPNDHTAGTAPGYPTPRAMVADNDLALGRIVEAITHSRFWDSTVVFVTEDDSQSGWDHVSPYRSTGFVLSPYSALEKTVRTNYNQTSMVRTIEQILGLPPMNIIDATADLMVDCFSFEKRIVQFQAVPNKISLEEMNPSLSQLKGRALQLAKRSATNLFTEIDDGDDDAMNEILWFALKGNTPYPKLHQEGKK